MTQRDRDRIARDLAIKMLEKYETCQFNKSKSSIPKENSNGAKYKMSTPTLLQNVEFVVDFQRALGDDALINLADILIEDVDGLTKPEYYEDLVLIGTRLRKKRFFNY